MADKNSGWACTHSATIVGEDNLGVTIQVICYWKNQGWRYDMNGVSAWVYCAGQEVCVKSSSAIDTTGNNQAAYAMGSHNFYIAKNHASQSISCYAKITSTSSYVSGTKSSGASYVGVSAKPSYAVTYNLNGGRGSFGNQVKWYNEELTLHSAKPTRDGHNFVRWNTNTSNTGTGYAPGGKYNGNAGLTLYAIWTPQTHTVTFNANGGTGAPAAQTKVYGTVLKLSSTIPTRANYNFKGWATSANGGVIYSAGGDYGTDVDVTLYAVCELAYVKPRISNFTANRCTSNGTVSETGTYIKVSFGWATDKTVTGINVQYKLQTSSTWLGGALTYSGTTSGNVTQAVGQGNISTESSYHVRVYVTDSGGTTYSATLSIGTVKFPIDVKAGGTGVAIGKVAENANEFDVGLNARFRGTVYIGSSTSIDGNLSLNGMFTRYGHNSKSFLYILDAMSSKGRYYKLVSIPATSDGNAITVNIKGFIGNWTGSKATIDIQISNRETLRVYGNYIGHYSVFGSQRIVIYKESDNSHTVYLYNVSDYTGPDVLNITCGSFGAVNPSIVTDYSYTTAPSGTLAYSSTTSTMGNANGAVVLFDNASGTRGAITLNENAGNFSYLEIFYGTSSTTYAVAEKLDAPNGKNCRIAWAGSTYSYYKDLVISGTSITNSTVGRVAFKDGAYDNTEDGANVIYIRKIIGYR